MPWDDVMGELGLTPLINISGTETVFGASPVSPEVVRAVHDANIRNYSIYLRRLPDDNLYLFSYLEYAGADYASDMRKLADNPKVKEWWKLTDPCQQPLPDHKPGEWWSALEEVSHLD